MTKSIEAMMFTVGMTIGGAPAVLSARVFIDDGKIVGVRSLRLLRPDGSGAALGQYATSPADVEIEGL